MRQWNDLPPTRGRYEPSPRPHLRIITPYVGYLNMAARGFLFSGQPAGFVQFQKQDDGLMSVVATAEGNEVTARGRVMVRQVTKAVPGRIPVTLLLAALPAAIDGERRLVFAGVGE